MRRSGHKPNGDVGGIGRASERRPRSQRRPEPKAPLASTRMKRGAVELTAAQMAAGDTVLTGAVVLGPVGEAGEARSKPECALDSGNYSSVVGQSQEVNWPPHRPHRSTSHPAWWWLPLVTPQS